MQTTLPRHDIVLLGVGHTNAHVLRMWRMDPIPDARLTCVSNFPVVTYSGMLPGVLAGQYPPERMQIDLVRLCAAAGARLIIGEVTGLDPDAKTLLFADRPPLPFDALSIGIGSVPARNGVENDGTLLEIKPMQTFLQRLDDRLIQLREQIVDRPLRVAVVGAGAGGVEIGFCLPARVHSMSPFAPRKDATSPTGHHPDNLELTLVTSDNDIASGTANGTRKRVRRELEARGVRILTDCRVTGIKDGMVFVQQSDASGETASFRGAKGDIGGEQLPADLVLWATGASAPPLLDRLPLPKDDRGFLLTRASLQTTADLPVFAVGDSGTIQGEKLPKAGVYAVRQGPVLWENLHRILAGKPLQDYVPQRSFLKLLNTGDGRAIAEYKGLSFHGRWCWKLKDRIDARFMDKYQTYEPMPPRRTQGFPKSLGSESAAMRCGGCGGKIGGSVLSRVLKRLEIPTSEHVLLGLDRPDDAAIVVPPNGRPLAVTVDFFAAPLDDPYLVGRIAALNSASDLFAMGAKPTAALALATIPVGPESQQEQMLFELLSGSLREFREMGTSLIGGHTIEGPRTTMGFTMLAEQTADPPRTKDRLNPGDVLILTKPLGTGVLLAAHMRAECRAEWFPPLMASMLGSNQPAAQVADEFAIAATTDVTGFGLAGHLLEMLEASNVSCELWLPRIPLLPGVGELIGKGIASTLAPANRAAEASIQIAAAQRDAAEFPALFDPQTGGGLLLGVAAENVESFLVRLNDRTGVAGHAVGRVTEFVAGPRIVAAKIAETQELVTGNLN